MISLLRIRGRQAGNIFRGCRPFRASRPSAAALLSPIRGRGSGFLPTTSASAALGTSAVMNAGFGLRFALGAAGFAATAFLAAGFAAGFFATAFLATAFLGAFLAAFFSFL